MGGGIGSRGAVTRPASRARVTCPGLFSVAPTGLQYGVPGGHSCVAAQASRLHFYLPVDVVDVMDEMDGMDGDTWAGGGIFDFFQRNAAYLNGMDRESLS